MARIGQSGGGNGVKNYDTEALLLADTPADSTIGYAKDTDNYWSRANSQWHLTTTPDRTIEDLTIQVDPNTGHDDTVPTIYQTQAQFDARGPFASYKGAMNALPKDIVHYVRILHAAGAFTITSWDYFSGFERLNVHGLVGRTEGKIILDSQLGLIRSAGTSAMAVSTSDGWSVTLSSDPGLVDNAFRGKWLRVTVGGQVGDYKAIRSHTGTTFNVAGRFFNYGAGITEVEIVEPSTTFTITDISDQGMSIIVGNGCNDYTWDSAMAWSYRYILGAIKIIGPDYATLFFSDGAFGFLGTIIENLCVGVQNSTMWMDNLIIDGHSTAIAGISVGDFANLNGGGSESSWLIRNCNWGILADGLCYVYLTKGSIDDCQYDSIFVTNGAFLNTTNDHVRGSGSAGYGIVMGDSYGFGLNPFANAAISAINMAPPWGFRGVLGDMLIDGVVKSYADLVTYPVIIGEEDSIVKGSYSD